jgi:capsular exopolysaccharide synthesis family protein
MELRQYLQIAQRWAWLLILGLVVGAGGGYFLTTYQTPVYKSSTKILVSSSQDQNAAYLSYLNDQQLAQTYIQLLTTQPVLAAVGEKLGYPVNSGQITAQLVSNTQLILLSVEDTNPERAAAICNTLVEELISQNEMLQANRFTSSEESLKAQLAQVQSQITTLQFQVADISEQSLQAQQEDVKAEIDQLETQILTIQKDIAEITPAKAPTSQTPVPTSSPEQTSLLQEKQLELEQLQSTLGFYQSIYLNLVGKGSAGTSLTLENVQLTQLQSTLNLYQQIYSNLLNSYESIRLARLQNTPNVVQVEMATANSNPIRPRPVNNIALGAAVGLMAAAGIVFLIEYMDDTIKSPRDISQLFDVPVIGYIAEMSQDPNSKSTVYVARQPRSPVTEAFRSLRTNIDFANVEKPLKTILVASANPSEGKTTVAVNLAMVYALSGKRVTIVDADMRRPQVHHYLGMSNWVGLSNAIGEGGSESSDAIERPWKETTLSVITSGSLPQNPAELLGSEKMLQFIETLEQETHISIIDSPPFVVSDAAILAAKVDGVILVVQPGKTHASSIEATLEQLSRVDAKVLGFVFNRIPRNRGYYYGGYQHYSHYYAKEYSGYFSEQGSDGNKPSGGGLKKEEKREESDQK